MPCRPPRSRNSSGCRGLGRTPTARTLSADHAQGITFSGSTFLVGGLVAYGASKRLDVSWLVPVAAGNFLYIGASDLVPEVNKAHSLRLGFLHLVSFAAGLALLLAVAVIAEHGAP